MASIVTVTSSDNGKSLDVHVGDEIVVSLAENPTTGFRWELQGPAGNALAPEGDAFELAPNPAVGSGGTHQFRLSAKAPGSATIGLRLVRPWASGQPPLQTFTVDINVSP